MNDFKAWAKDKNNQMILITAVVGALVLLGVVIWKNSSKPNTSADASGAATTAAAGPSPVGATPGMANGTIPGLPNNPMAASGTATTASAAPVAAPKAEASMLPYRSDPFVDIVPPAPKNAGLIKYLGSLSHVRVAPVSVDVRDNGPEIVDRPQPTRRLSGVMWNGKVSAVVETNGESRIVVPGEIYEAGGSKVKVQSIQPSYVLLKTLDTKPARIIQVNLASGSTSSGSGSAPSGSIPGMPTGNGGIPGMIGGGGGIPGMIGGGGGIPGMIGGGAIGD